MNLPESASGMPSARQRDGSLKGLAFLDLDTEYRTGDGDLMADFYRPCLSRASRYDRAVGYFRSSVFAVAGYAVIQFALRGGRIRMVCSPSLTADDLEALSRGYDKRQEVVAGFLDREVSSLLTSVDLRSGAEVLATLIALEVLDLRVAIRPPSFGIYHEKIGMFLDDFGNSVSFRGSSNETWRGWHLEGNLESFEVFCSWRGEDEAQRVARHQKYIERLWSGHLPNLEVVPFPDAVKRKLCTIAKDRLEDLAPPDSPRTSLRKPQPHQLSALDKWRLTGRRGILEHATGSGKTYTALLAIKEHVRSGSTALVVVPSRLLLTQWAGEIAEEIPEAVVLKAGAGNNSWRQGGRLEGLSRAGHDLGPRIILSTMQTASKPEFRHRLQDESQLLLVADEVHQSGSPGNSGLFEIQTTARLGLSATPERYGDPSGTAKLISYFGDVIQPPFRLPDAIASGLLVPYEYYPHPVRLGDGENEAWRALTMDIKREVARLPHGRDGQAELTDRIKLLLIQRSRIAKKAAAKIPLASSVLKERYEDGQRWLVYCEDIDQLEAVLAHLRSQGIEANEYHSRMVGSLGATLEWFRQFGGILVSVHCLDEGVDIPSVSHALILASSQNPRQFIQRRGRVLRKAPWKAIAVVHDAIVVPDSIEDEPDQVALARAELVRALEFARSAINRYAGAELRDIAVRMGIDPNSLSVSGMEEDDDASDD
jgi:superfamily II DNA or RNA helicase